MGDRSQIEWTDATWNPTRGCSKVSEGCRNCYAMRQAIRQSGPGGAYEGLVRTVPGKGPQWTGEVRLVEEALELPLRWREPRRVFVDSMSDLWHDDVPTWFIARVFAVMAGSHRHTYQVLTKRPARAAAVLSDPEFWAEVWQFGMQDHWDSETLAYLDELSPESPLMNVWIGTSVENQSAADERIPDLLRTPAAVRFLSCEPLLGHVDIERFGRGRALERIHWVIAGGESGPGARPCSIEWLRSLRDQCQGSGVAFFLKQMGACVWHAQHTVRLKDRKGGDIERWPADLRIREFPEARVR